MRERYVLQIPHYTGATTFSECTCTVVVRPDHPRSFTINSVYVPSLLRGHGYARQVMRAVLRDADKEQATLYLQPVPDLSKPKALTQVHLIAWYKRLGFRELETEPMMVRKPRR